jgi:hypothetical protein
MKAGRDLYYRIIAILGAALSFIYFVQLHVALAGGGGCPSGTATHI